MLFFRSEERLREWCDARRAKPGPVVSMDQLWGMATQWYGNRLEPSARRPGPAEMRQIFAGLGLTGAFWDLQADVF